MSITVTLEANRLKCPSCEELIDLDGNPLKVGYECQNCGEADEERRCSSCNLFKSKCLLCPECEQVIEQDPDELMVPIITCGCHDEEHEVNI